MPTYLYMCSTHGEYESFHSIRDDARHTECELCRKEKDISTPVERLITGDSRGVVELTGQDLIAKNKQDAEKFKRDVHSSERIYSNVLGESRYEQLQQNIDKRKRGG